MRKIICFAAALLPVLLLPATAWAQPYEISNYAQLKSFATTVNGGSTSANAILTADIVCNDATWVPIGNESNAYTGTFDGQGHIITGLNNTENTVSNFAGLFGHLGSGGVVKNLTLSGATITGKENVGGIVGKNAGGTVTNCRVEGNVTVRARAAYAQYLGGIVGWNTSSGTISGCISAAAVSNNGYNYCTYFGGIVGYFFNGTFKDCLYTGTTVSAQKRFGALTGTFGSGGGTMNNNYYTTIELGGNGSENSGSNDMSGCRRAYTVTLGTNVEISGTQTSYSHSGLTAYVDNTKQSKALSYTEGNTTTYYCGQDQKLTLKYAGSNNAPTGYHRAYSYNDGSDHEVDGNTLTMPAANIYVTCTGDVPNTYKVVFKSNGGSGSMADQAFTYGVAQNLTSNAFNRSGYIYSGWNTQSNGSGTAYSDGQNVTNLTTTNNGTVYLYAQWTPDFATHWHADADHDGTTEERAYIITTPEGLELLASEVQRGNNFSGKFFALGSDIAYEHSSNWNAGGNTENNHLPIGRDNNKFYGIFDGRGHTIRGVRVNNNSSYSGLFGYIDGEAVVKNITLTDSRIRSAEHAGGISGYVGTGSIENCHVTATVAVYAVADNSDELGGIAGTNWGAINGCTSSATVTSRNLSACNSYGGIAGRSEGTIMNCLALNATVSAGTTYGAVAGDSEGSIINTYFRSCKIVANYFSNGFSINAGANVTLAPAGDATQSFPYGGLQAYSNVLLHDGTYYATGDNDVSLTFNYTGPGTPIAYMTTGGTLSGSSTSYTLTMPWSDVTVEAVFPETVVYTVHFDANGGNGTMADLPFTYDQEQALTPCTFHRTGYVFTGWNTTVYGNGTAYDNQQSVSNITSCFGASVTLYAQWSPDYATYWHADAEHDGKTAERAYIITTAEGLQLLSSMSFQGNHFAGTFFKLGADIDMDEAGEFIPVGYLWDFRGYFDGDNHRINGLYVNLPDDEGSGVGLFGNASSGTIKNVTLFGARIIGNYDVGGIVGYVEGNCTVSNCHVIGSTIYATSSDFPYVGAIVGYTDYIGTLAGNTYHSSLVYAPNYASELFQLFHPGGDAFNIGVGYSGYEYSHSQKFCGDFTAASLDATQLTLPEDSGQRAAILAAYQNPGAHTAYNGTPPNVSGLFGNLSASPATIFGEAKYVTTFFNGTIDYLLSPGAKAYTASISGTTVLFHQIGDDGSVIPHGTAAIIVSESASIPLTQLASTNVTAHPGSVLRGSDVDVAVTAGMVNGKTPYVLGISGNTLGFYIFNGSTIPAGKAFYLK